MLLSRRGSPLLNCTGASSTWFVMKTALAKNKKGSMRALFVSPPTSVEVTTDAAESSR